MTGPAATAAPSRGASKAVRRGGPLARRRAWRHLPAEQRWARLVYLAKRGWFALPFYPALLPGCGEASPLATPPDPWPGRAEQGLALLGGLYRFAGQSLQAPAPLWQPAEASQAWLAELHAFAWLRDLRAAGSDAARRRARELTQDWLDRHARWSEPAWAPLTLARRLTHWLGQWDFLAASAEHDFRQAVLASATAQGAHLAHSLPAGLAGADLICAVKGLAIVGACLPGGERWLGHALGLLTRELPRQILPDGGHIERSPSRHLAALRDLIDVKAMLHAAGREPPVELEAAIDAMAPMLRLFLHGDGGLALFNGSTAEEALKIDLVLQRAGSRGRPRLSAPESGFQRLQAGRTLAIVDAGAPPPPGQDGQAHAGTLSFELSVGRERMIVNCGTPGADGGPAAWIAALRGTAAHSTLELDGRSSSEPLPVGLWSGPGLATRPQSVSCRREEAEGATLLELTHDGYKAGLRALHRRRLYLAAAGDDLRGEDRIERSEGARPAGFAIRFHLHPEVQASLLQTGDAALLRLPRGGGWRLRASGGTLAIEDSIYWGEERSRRCQQLVITGTAGPGTTVVKWALRREAGKRD
ncbi:Uncharacterized conserved protein, heparinase superfamily [Tistlia consotensis]|uniref:Uncharacterized conserved protein, heparinase superfamily n=1 Tax=Tistlia consotensis USBA 355 TaxID=560819 RepID=A0A1Y6CSJ5_9PROT|nr:heparinase II/III family protein [Tistlia consotensis]SMF74862.1 Uncharacterized conserved protein, heparinase superfamily [Tistlia consotensis USBA 355]SNS11258.1 Uncharacterized conserved protein, heparinase superfamily [Tistlia consotensis]